MTCPSEYSQRLRESPADGCNCDCTEPGRGPAIQTQFELVSSLPRLSMVIDPNGRGVSSRHRMAPDAVPDLRAGGGELLLVGGLHRGEAFEFLHPDAAGRWRVGPVPHGPGPSRENARVRLANVLEELSENVLVMLPNAFEFQTPLGHRNTLIVARSDSNFGCRRGDVYLSRNVGRIPSRTSDSMGEEYRPFERSLVHPKSSWPCQSPWVNGSPSPTRWDFRSPF